MLDKQFVISLRTIFATLLVLLGGYVVYKLAPILELLFVSLFLVISMERAIKFFTRLTFMNRPLSRGFSVILSYVLLVLILVLIVTLGFPPVLLQAQNLLMELSKLPQTINLGGELQIPLTDFLPSFSEISGSIFATTYSIFAHLASIVSVLGISAYISLDWLNIKKSFINVLPDSASDEAAYILNSVEESIGHWVKGQLFLMLIVGSMSFVALKVLGINSALALALIAGLLEIIPILGPTISAILATIVGFSQDPLKGLIILALFVLIQQIENNFLVPKIMQKASGFRPIIVIFALLIGSSFFGIIGALLAVPVAMVGVFIVKRVLKFPSRSSAGSQ